MIKTITTTLMTVSSIFAFGQVNDYPTTGNPTIYQYSPSIYLRRNINGGGFTQGIQTQFLDGTNNWFFGNLHDEMWIVSKGDFQNPKMIVMANGNVGLGTINPLARLTLVGGTLATAGAGLSVSSNLTNGRLTSGIVNSIHNYLDQESLELSSGSSQKTGIAIEGQTSSYGSAIRMFTGNDERIRIATNGNVGVGTSSPTDKLSVNGNIRAHEIKVETTNWPDYVFAKSYQLPTLQETEKHIKKKGYLPGMPSAAEVKANGIDLGEMNAKLLQKIEELTLHLIEQCKANNNQTELIKELQATSRNQQKEINQLKNKL